MENPKSIDLAVRVTEGLQPPLRVSRSALDRDGRRLQPDQSSVRLYGIRITADSLRVYQGKRDSVSDQSSAKSRYARTRGRAVAGRRTGVAAKEQRPSPWHPGALFHVSTRYPRKPHAVRVDRLAGILRNGLISPASCTDGSVCSDLNLVVTGTAVPYDSLVFLHQFGPQSWVYTLGGPSRFSVFVDRAIPVLTHEVMGAGWVVLCLDEVYVRDRVAPENLTGVAVHPADADSVVDDFVADFRRLGIPLYDYEGNVLWEPA